MTTTMPSEKNMDKPWGRASVATLIIVGVLYATSSRTRLAGGDSGELLAEACTGGVAHPPGYPLLLGVLRLARAIGAACTGAATTDVAAMANALNALFAALAAASITETVDRLLERRQTLEAALAGILFGTSPLTWEYALGLEVFALNNLLVGLLLLCFIEHNICPDDRSLAPLRWGALVCGLGLANQHTIVLFELPMIVWILVSARPGLATLAQLGLAFLAGLSCYTLTFIAAQTPTWGSWGDASTLTGLLRHVLRQEYGTFQLSPKPGATADIATRIGMYALDVRDEFTGAGVVLALFGIVSLLCAGGLDASTIVPLKTKSAPSISPKARRRTGVALVVVFAFYVAVFHGLANLPLDDPLAREVTRRFFMQPNALMALWIGYGLAHARRALLSLGWDTTIVRGAWSALVLAVVAMRIHATRHRFATEGVAQYDLIRDFGAEVLASLPPEALLVSYTDLQWNAVRYLQACEGLRQDVTHVNLQIMAFPWFPRQYALAPSVAFPRVLPDVTTERGARGYATYLTRFLRANLPQREIFLDLHAVDEAHITGDQRVFGLQVLPHGLTWRVSNSTDPEIEHKTWGEFAMPQSSTTTQLTRSALLVPPEAPIPRGSWEFAVVSITHDAIYQRNLARLGFWLGHGSVKTIEELQTQVLALYEIQRELRWLLRRIQRSGMISYELYPVEKNAMVSLQRFQLYLEVLANVVGSATTEDPRVQSVLHERSDLRIAAIDELSEFVSRMQHRGDPDTEAIRQGLEKIQARTKPPTDAAATGPTHTPGRASRSKKKQRKPKTKTKKSTSKRIVSD